MTLAGRLFLDSLTQKQREFLVPLCESLGNVAEAARRVSSEKRVHSQQWWMVAKSRVQELRTKAGVTTTRDLVLFLWQEGIIACPCMQHGVTTGFAVVPVTVPGLQPRMCRAVGCRRRFQPTRSDQIYCCHVCAQREAMRRHRLRVQASRSKGQVARVEPALSFSSARPRGQPEPWIPIGELSVK